MGDRVIISMSYKDAARKCEGCNHARVRRIALSAYGIRCVAPMRLKVHEKKDDVISIAGQVAISFTNMVYQHVPLRNSVCHQKSPTNLCSIATNIREAVTQKMGVVLPTERTYAFLSSRSLPRRSRNR